MASGVVPWFALPTQRDSARPVFGSRPTVGRPQDVVEPAKLHLVWVAPWDRLCVLLIGLESLNRTQSSFSSKRDDSTTGGLVGRTESLAGKPYLTGLLFG